MATANYLQRRGELQTYFDRTAVEAWRQLTSDMPVSRIRATVRAGRTRMREQLLAWLPTELTGVRVLDAGCGTGALAQAAADRGAVVVATDLSPTLLQLARDRLQHQTLRGAVEFVAGDMLDPALGRFDHIVAMDSLIHYQHADVSRALASFTARAERSVLFTFAPATRALLAMHAVGRLFPRGNRAPAIEPVRVEDVLTTIAREPALTGWRVARTQCIVSGFYTSQAMELVRQ